MLALYMDHSCRIKPSLKNQVPTISTWIESERVSCLVTAFVNIQIDLFPNMQWASEELKGPASVDKYSTHERKGNFKLAPAKLPSPYSIACFRYSYLL